MPFLDATPDLAGEKFTNADLNYARRYLPRLIDRCSPGWLQRPTGDLKWQWNAGGSGPACQLINLAHLLYTLERALTQNSVRVFEQKVRSLLEANGDAFDELLTELEVGSALTSTFSPIAFEPLVRAGAPAEAKESSPDYGILLPEGEVAIEVTVVRVGFLRFWRSRANEVGDAIRRAMMQRNLSGCVEIALPVDFSKEDLDQRTIDDLLRTVARSSRGETVCQLGHNRRTVVKWEPALLFSNDGEVIGDLPQGSGVVGVRTPLVPDITLRTRIIDSVRGSLDKKRRQRRKQHLAWPYLIAVKLGEPMLNLDWVAAQVDRRVWPNPQYESISGLIYYSPPQGFRQGDKHWSLTISLNPRARAPGPKSMEIAFEGDAVFHWP